MCTDGRRCENCPAKRLSAGGGVIARSLPALGTVVAVTANDAALLSHTGEYLAPALPGDALRCGDAYIGLRLHPDLIRDTYLAPRALTLASETGTHRAYFTPLSDELAIRALELAPADEPEPAEAVDWSAVNWSETDQLTHLDTLTPERYQVLPFTGARQVDPRVIPHLLAHLVDMDLPFTIAVPAGGCVQLHRGRAAMFDAAGAHFAVIFGACRYAMDPAYVGECWVTQASGATGLTSAIELYDHSNRCVTVITQTGAVCEHLHEAWEAIAASLPACDG
ncbi:hypothetical protein AFM11_21050 [Mycolicibacterium wolinskyi]|uniref:Haemin-degrading HemS/ChuX domain-containing protein n=1 Tax=Mycolicibacterium wolinskyi TaxID=59750 RepID=A0A132PJX9_9MYCO|nr:hypothetical protein [Mycolicibacterium wolinskyi]KWX22322.1 hypothetical protein AFM11_21050 [Mycolicibacterium wolinskyi]